MVGSSGEDNISLVSESSGSEPRHHDEAFLSMHIEWVKQMALRGNGFDKGRWSNDIDVPWHRQGLRQFNSNSVRKELAISVIVRPVACLNVLGKHIIICGAHSERFKHVPFVYVLHGTRIFVTC